MRHKTSTIKKYAYSQKKKYISFISKSKKLPYIIDFILYLYNKPYLFVFIFFVLQLRNISIEAL